MIVIFQLFISLLLSFSILANETIIYQLPINTPITPAIVDYIDRGLQKAVNEDAGGILLILDVPSGLDKSISSIANIIQNSSIPVISYISPTGSQINEIAIPIIESSHIKIMAPGTHLNYSLSKTIKKNIQRQKDYNELQTSYNNFTQENESTTALKPTKYPALPEYPKEVLRDNITSFSAYEALKLDIIDYVAVSRVNAIQKAGSKPIIINKKTIQISTPTTIVPLPPDTRNAVIRLITNPDVVYLLLLLGLYCLMFEVSIPGLYIPGFLGFIFSIIAIFGLTFLPVSWLSFCLILIGSICLTKEISQPNLGKLGVLGSGLFLIGSMYLISSNSLQLNIHNSAIILSTCVNILFIIVSVSSSLEFSDVSSHFKSSELIGKTGVSLETFNTKGHIIINGDIMDAIALHPIKKNDQVVISNIIKQKAIIMKKEEIL